MKLAQRVATMPRSGIRVFMRLANERIAAGGKVFHLGVGELDDLTPKPVIEAAFAAALEGSFTKYTPEAGVPALREAIARRSTEALGYPVSAEDVAVTCGSVQALFASLLCAVDSGDEVLIPDPCWPNLLGMVHMAGAVPIWYRLEVSNGYVPVPDEVEKLVTPRTRAIVLNSPGNPTGAVFPAEVMKGFAELAERRDLVLISDEIYQDFVFDGTHVSPGRFGARDRTFVASGFSKCYAMTGWRLGYALCPPGLATAVASMQEPMSVCPPAISQKAAEEALRIRAADAFLDKYRRRRDILAEIFDGTGLVSTKPAGAFYALVDIGRTGQDSWTFARQLIADEGVVVVPGATFGPSCDRAVRVAFTVDDETLRNGLTILRDRIMKG